ncbi:MAG TPA: hypothetical protein VFX22_09650 [Candidatus Kapabacteria bacterium]|nr:hypothetical protein [Candidatus Kapabacteria bacterium]
MRKRTDREPKKSTGRLTEELEAKIPNYRMKWRSLALATKPIHRAEAEDLVRRIYRALGETPPQRFVWAASPARALAASVLLEASHPNNYWFQIPYRSWHARDEVLNFLDQHDAERLMTLIRDPWVEHLNEFLIMAADREMRFFGQRNWKIVRSQLEREAGVYLSDDTFRGAASWPSMHFSHRFEIRDLVILAANEFLYEVAGHPIKRETRLFARLLQHFGAFYHASENVAVLLERPTFISLDEAGRVHNDLGPAINYRAAAKIYAWHGVAVPDHVVTHPKLITIREIMQEQNTEIRRVLIERFGWERYIRESDARVLDTSERGSLMMLPMPQGDRNEAPEAIRVLRVQNSTPEPDGTRKNYFIRVPPDITTANAAVAWSFGMGEKEYAPLLET